MLEAVRNGASAPPPSHSFGPSLKFEDKDLAALFARLPAEVTLPWTDLRADKTFWKKGVDYRLQGGVQVDFKVERRDDTPNCAAELISYDRPILKPSWLYTSQSHWIIHYFKCHGVLVCLPTTHYQKWVLSLLATLKRGSCTSVRNAPQTRPRDEAPDFYSWVYLMSADEAILNIQGAYWCRLPGAKDNILLSRLAETTKNPARQAENTRIQEAELPLSLFTSALQSRAEPATPVPDADKLMPGVYAQVMPLDRCAKYNKAFYIQLP